VRPVSPGNFQLLIQTAVFCRTWERRIRHCARQPTAPAAIERRLQRGPPGSFRPKREFDAVCCSVNGDSGQALTNWVEAQARPWPQVSGPFRHKKKRPQRAADRKVRWGRSCRIAGPTRNRIRPIKSKKPSVKKITQPRCSSRKRFLQARPEGKGLAARTLRRVSLKEEGE